MRGMSCRAKRILAVAERERASLPSYRLHSRHDRNRIIGRARYATSVMPNIMLAADERADIIAYM